jgi:hypothetical protein
MPNWCSDSVIFIQEDGKNDRILELKAMLESEDNPAPNASEGWIGNTLLRAGIFETEEEVETIYARAFVEYIDVRDDNTLFIQVNSAWSPCTQAYNLLAEHFNLRYVLFAEEGGCEIYINTDVSGEYFPERYYLTCNGEDEEIEELFWDLDCASFETEQQILDLLISEKILPPDSPLELLRDLIEPLGIEIEEYSTEA